MRRLGGVVQLPRGQGGAGLPETCADFLGSFGADKTKSECVKGGKWLVRKFEVCIWAMALPFFLLRFLLLYDRPLMGGIKSEASGRKWRNNFLSCMGLFEQCGTEFQTLANCTLC